MVHKMQKTDLEMNIDNTIKKLQKLLKKKKKQQEISAYNALRAEEDLQEMSKEYLRF
jgi:ribosome recycling factor